MSATKQANRAWYLTCYLYSFICMGMAMSLTGPTLLEIGRQSHATRQQLPLLYSCRSVGVFAGTFIGGFLVDRFKRRGNSLLATFILQLCIISAFTPNIPSLTALAVVCFMQGCFIGCVDNVAQILLINVYQAAVAPYMQALHCAFGVGAVLAPLIASPFLDKTLSDDSDQASKSSGQYQYAYYILSGSMVPCLILLMTLSLRDEWHVSDSNKQPFTRLQETGDIEIISSSAPATSADSTGDINKYDEPIVNQSDARLISSAIPSEQSGGAEQAVAPTAAKADVTSSHRLKVVALVGCFLFLYVGCESGYGNYLTAYTTRQLSMDEHTGSLVTSVFWACFTAGRLLAIVLSIYLSAAVMIGVDLLGCIAALLMIMMFSHSQNVLWFCSAFYGLAVASIYPTAINHAEHTVSLTGRHLSILTAFATAGEAIIPLMIGEAMVNIKPVWMMVIMFTSAVLATLVITYVLRMKPQTSAKQLSSADDGVTTEMTSLRTSND